MGMKISWWVPRIGKEEQKLIRQVLDNHFPNEGKLTTLFEKKISDLVGSKHAVAVTSGTAAMFLALKALGISSGDEVILPDVTFVATANAVDLCGAKPVLVDVDATTLCMGPSSFERAITKNTKAVIPVHVSGRACRMDDIVKIAKKKHIYIIEDAAEALTSKYKGRCLGTLGEAGCFSFSAHKTITTGQGGMVVTDNEKLYRRLIELKDQGRPVRGTGGDDLHNTIGYNFKFTDLQAAVGLGQLKYLNSRLEKIKKIYRRYIKGLDGVKGVKLFRFNIEEGEVPQWTDAFVDRRDELDAYLRKREIDCRRFWFPVHTQKPYRLPDKGFPNSTRLSPRALWLPSAFTLSDSDVDLVCKRIREFLTGR